MKTKSEMHEGREAFTNFKNTMKVVLSVPHDEIKKRIAEHKEKAAKNPSRRGPKPKASASRASGAS